MLYYLLPDESDGVRWLTLILGAVGIACCVIAYGWWSGMPSMEISRALSNEIRRGPGRIVDFAQIAPFPWDRVYVFGPYTPKKRIEERLGFRWDGSSKSGIDWDDGIQLAVFVHNQSVCCWFEHTRHEDLSSLVNPVGFSRQEAKFRVVANGDGRLSLQRAP